MAKNIVIAEGGTAKSFTAKKIKTKAQGSGTVNWVPEDEVLDYVDLKDKTFTTKGTYKPSDFNCDGFNEVTVDIPADVKEKTITKNGTFYAADDECLGYSKVTVAVPEGGGGGPYTVRFFGDDYETILKTDANVPYRGSASCTDLDGTVLNGLYFKGWNPSPTNVTGDMNCYPVRGDYVIDPNEIQDDWETICADCGAHYPLGAYKALVVNIPKRPNAGYLEFNTVNAGKFYSSNDVTNDAFSIAMHMVKVAEGEDGSTSTWLSTGVLPIFPYWDGGRGGYSGEGDKEIRSANIHWPHPSPTDGTLSPDILMDWMNSPIREYLNNYLITQLPEILGATIKAVNKVSKSLNVVPYSNPFPSNPVHVDKSSIDKIWIPSYKELYSFMETKTGASDFRAASESSGIDYTAVYMPTYPAGSRLTRSLYAQNYFRMGHVNLYQSNMNELSMYGGYKGVSSGSPIGFCL